jgi:predicted AAA+ superfamily ATPase
VQEVSKLERRASMQKLAEDIFAHSGETFEATKYAPAAGVSRTTVTNYLKVLEKTYLVNLVKPFNSRRATEIIAVPKVYAFDSGFVAYHRGWNQLRRTDLPLMWEHFVLNELHANLQSRQFYYWKDKRNHQVSFVFARSIRAPIAIDCAWSSADYDWSGLEAFRRQYPHGESFVVSNDVTEPFSTTLRQTTARFVPLNQIVDLLLA